MKIVALFLLSWFLLSCAVSAASAQTPDLTSVGKDPRWKVAGRSRPVQGSFAGVAFRVVHAQTHDAVYFRPFNFRSEDPARRAHSVQYVSDPEWPWDRLRSRHPGEYEKAIVPAPDGDEWFHARIAIERRQVSVYVNGAATPALTVKELSDRSSGSVGVWVGEGSGGSFANLRVTQTH